MLKKKRQLFELLFMVADLLVVSVAWLAAYWLRFDATFFEGIFPVDKGVPDIQHYLSMLLFIWLIWAFVFRRMGLYRAMRGVRQTRERLLLVNANVLGVLFLIAVTYLFREKSIPFSRLVFLYFAVFAIVFTLLERTVLRSVLREIRRRGYNLRYMLLVGSGQVATDIALRIRNNSDLGIQLIGALSKSGQEDKGPCGLPLLGGYDDLERVLTKMDVDQVVIALPLEDNVYISSIMKMTRQSLADVKIVPDLYKFVSLGGSIGEFEGLPIISVQESPLEGFNLFLKRFFDLVMASIILIILAIPMLIIACCVKLSSKGSVLYRQERVSYDGTPFKIFKFRSMRVDAESAGPGWTTKNDERVTKIGRFLRSTSLDELPQLFNVLRGDMSLVGPRPERPVYIEEFREEIPRYYLRHKVPAGMTGWAQVNGWRGDTSIDKRIEFDLYYIENWTLFLDLKILLLTLWRGFKNSNAY